MPRSRHSFLHALALMLPLCGALSAQAADETEAASQGLRWQARLEIGGALAESNRGSSLLSARLMGDYYLTGPLWSAHQQGGLRATGGILLGSGALRNGATGPGSLWSPLSLQQSVTMGVGNPYGLHDSATSQPYLGLGYTALSAPGGWRFSADIGLLLPYRTTMRLGSQPDESIGDLRLRPVLQLGWNYRF